MLEQDLPAACQQGDCTPVGTIRWPRDTAGTIPSASVTVCTSAAHQQWARQRVRDITSHDGEFLALDET